MPFLIFELIFAVVGIAFLAVLGFMVRELRRKRQAEADQPSAEPGPQPQAEIRPAKAPVWGLKKKAPEPEPEPDEPPAPRRRQLASFAEAAAAEADQVEEESLPVLPAAPPAQAWPVETSHAATLLAEAPEAPAPSVVEPEPSMPDVDDADVAEPVAVSDFEQAVLSQLEDAFDALQSGALTLEAYTAQVQAAESQVEQRIAELSDDTDPAELDAALAARESVRWCLNWANEQGHQS